jgi:hypothetical protein
MDGDFDNDVHVDGLGTLIQMLGGPIALVAWDKFMERDKISLVGAKFFCGYLWAPPVNQSIKASLIIAATYVDTGFQCNYLPSLEWIVLPEYVNHYNSGFKYPRSR